MYAGSKNHSSKDLIPLQVIKSPAQPAIKIAIGRGRTDVVGIAGTSPSKPSTLVELPSSEKPPHISLPMLSLQQSPSGVITGGVTTKISTSPAPVVGVAIFNLEEEEAKEDWQKPSLPQDEIVDDGTRSSLYIRVECS